MAKKIKEEEKRICRICNGEIIGEFEHIKTKRKTEMYICKKHFQKTIQTGQ